MKPIRPCYRIVKEAGCDLARRRQQKGACHDCPAQMAHRRICAPALVHARPGTGPGRCRPGHDRTPATIVPVRRRRNGLRARDFGKTDIDANGRISQQVFLVGPDGKDYEALYTLELQPDGVYRITGVSLRAANTMST